VSLIADALKAAQQEKSKRAPLPASASAGGFFSTRSGGRTREGLPRPLVYALVAAGAIGVVFALVTLLLSAKSSPQSAAVPPELAQPIVSPPTTPVPAPVALTDSASAIQAQAGAQTGAPPLVAPSLSANQTPLPTSTVAQTTTTAPAKTLTDSLNKALPVTDTTTPVIVPRPPGTLKITMEQQPVVDIRPLFAQALAAQRRGDVNVAKELYARALDRDPQNAELYNNVGTLYKSTGELDRAEDAYRHAIAINPRLAAAWSNLGVLLDERGRRKEAIAALQQAVAIDPSNAGTKVNLALQYHAAGLFSDARRLLQDAINSNPALAEAQYALARTLEAQGERSSAIQHYDLFLTISNGRFPQLERQVTQHLVKLRSGQ
jgi:Flp pilus assembly protein TadD